MRNSIPNPIPRGRGYIPSSKSNWLQLELIPKLGNKSRNRFQYYQLGLLSNTNSFGKEFGVCVAFSTSSKFVGLTVERVKQSGFHNHQIIWIFWENHLWWRQHSDLLVSLALHDESLEDVEGQVHHNQEHERVPTSQLLLVLHKYKEQRLWNKSLKWQIYAKLVGKFCFRENFHVTKFYFWNFTFP